MRFDKEIDEKLVMLEKRKGWSIFHNIRTQTHILLINLIHEPRWIRNFQNTLFIVENHKWFLHIVAEKVSLLEQYSIMKEFQRFNSMVYD